MENLEPGENLTLRLAKETVQFITVHRDSGFFAMLSFYAVHGPIQTTAGKWEKYRRKAEVQGIQPSGYVMERHLPIRVVQDNPIYAGLVETVDDAVGLVLRSLDELGLAQNTIVIFTSDNGGVASGDSYSTANLPLRGGKGYQWEGGIREPYFIKVPWLPPVGKVLDYPVTGADFYPTILDLADLTVPVGQGVEGVSLQPLMLGASLPQRPLYWHYPHYGNQGGDPSSMIREGPWKLIHYWEDGHDELYNLETDPVEQQDVAQSNALVARKLRGLLDSWLISVEAKVPVKDITYDPVLAAARSLDIITDRWPQLEKERMEMLKPEFQPNADWWGSQIVVSD